MTSGFGELLRELRRQAGMTQDELAGRAGIAVRTIRRLERDGGSNPRLGTVKLLADALGIAPEDHRRLLAAAAGGSAVPAETPAAGGEPAGEAESTSAAGGAMSRPVPGGEAAGGPAAPEGVAGEVGSSAAAGGEPAGGPAAPEGVAGEVGSSAAPGGVPAGGAETTPAPDAVLPRRTPLGELADAAEQLAHAVAGRWQREEEQRRIHDPFPLPVRWRPLPAPLTDHWANIRRVPAGGTAGPLDLSGELGEIAATYRRIPSGRLVVLGRAGSGKTVLTLRFVLDRLRTRTPADPVPVLFGLGSWDPGATALRDWLTEGLLRDYPGLAAAAPGGSTLAAALVEAGHVLPVLDGFDEIADGLHRAALEALNGTTLPLVLTSRPAEYTVAVAATDVLTAAAGVELTDLTPGDLLGYLPRTTRRPAPGGGPGTVWNPVLTGPGGAALAAVLSTPLMVVLARTVYSDAPGEDPAVLLDTTRFPTAEAVEDHLLGSFVPTVYRDRPRWDPGRARRWLGHLARHLDRLGTHDLAWWRLGGSLRRSSRILAVVLSAMLATAVADWLFFVPVDVAALGFLPGLRAALVDGLLVGSVVGLAFGLVHGIMVVYGGLVFEPSRMQVRLRGRTGRPEGGLLRRYAGRFGAGLLGGFVVGLGYGPVTVLSRAMATGFPPRIEDLVTTALVNTLVSGLVFGLAAGATFGLVAVLETPLDISSAASPATLLRANRTTVLRQALAFGPLLALAIAAGGRIVVELLQGVFGPLVWTLTGGLVVGAVGGLGGAVAYVFAFTAWGQWLMLSRVWLPLTGRLPWATAAFLEDAYRRGILRQAGAVYQFRHARLQDHLARTAEPPETGATASRGAREPAPRPRGS
ncbi:helix-turn-helix domain-containing protein [Amycolatopsis sp. A133]|uniref:helix-turn-helix domain-containing protein n=1 Tax=Amycolatopsis sp. A133 TaxID=3064472 RepID=UPI0027EBAE30|nr:helix-turn-helix domain-containing protein [Amycolatopsis sp. A133]MDQ7803017.1 helix-turn-helix domain-containing protein [Amycolatopsis sp. A133]